MLDPGRTATVRLAAELAAPSSPPADTARHAAVGGMLARLYIAVVVALLLVGFAQTIYPVLDLPALEERRQPTPLDDYWGRLWRHDPLLPETLSKWFDDRFGFRPTFVRLYNEISYRLFGVNDRVYVGQNSILFNKESIKANLNVNRPSHHLFLAASAIFKNIPSLAAYLKTRDVKLVVIPIPSKDTFFRQYLPASAPAISYENLTYPVRRFLSHRTDLIYIDAETVLRSAMTGVPGSQLVYLRTDPHLSFWGGMAVARALTTAIAADAHLSPPPWYEFKHYYTQPGFAGSDARFMGLLKPLSEDVHFPTDTNFLVDNELGYWTKDPNFHGVEALNQQTIYEFAYRTRAEFAATRLPPIVVYGDSFADTLFPGGLPHEFQAIYRARMNYNRSITEVLRELPADVKYFVIVYNEYQTSSWNLPQLAISP